MFARKDGDIRLRAFPEDTKSEAVDFYSKPLFLCLASSVQDSPFGVCLSGAL